MACFGNAAIPSRAMRFVWVSDMGQAPVMRMFTVVGSDLRGWKLAFLPGACSERARQTGLHGAG